MQSLPDDISFYMSTFLDLKSAARLSRVNKNLQATYNIHDDKGFCKKCDIRFSQVPANKRLHCITTHPIKTSWSKSDLHYSPIAIHGDELYNKIWFRDIDVYSNGYHLLLQSQPLCIAIIQYQQSLTTRMYELLRYTTIPDYFTLVEMRRLLYHFCVNCRITTLQECTIYLEGAKANDHEYLWLGSDGIDDIYEDNPDTSDDDDGERFRLMSEMMELQRMENELKRELEQQRYEHGRKRMRTTYVTDYFH